MSKFSFQVTSFTPTATADGTLGANTYMALIPGTTTQNLSVSEIYMGGQAGASSVNAMTFARTSTLGVGPSALASPNSAGPMNAQAAVITTVPVAYVTVATTQPARASAATVARLNLTFNAFGGIVRWVAYPGEEWTAFGNATTSNSESVLSAQNIGTAGLMGAHIIYEPL